MLDFRQSRDLKMVYSYGSNTQGKAAKHLCGTGCVTACVCGYMHVCCGCSVPSYWRCEVYRLHCGFQPPGVDSLTQLTRHLKCYVLDWHLAQLVRTLLPYCITPALLLLLAVWGNKDVSLLESIKIIWHVFINPNYLSNCTIQTYFMWQWYFLAIWNHLSFTTSESGSLNEETMLKVIVDITTRSH